jgi:hypothetical protein
MRDKLPKWNIFTEGTEGGKRIKAESNKVKRFDK